MANIVITSTTDRVDVVFNDYSASLGMISGSWGKDKIIAVLNKTDRVAMIIQDEKEWLVSFDGTAGTFQVDTIDTVAPTSNSDLYDKLKVLIQ